MQNYLRKYFQKQLHLLKKRMMSHLNLSADIVDMVKLSLQSLFQIFQLSFKNQTNEKNPTSIA